MKKPHIKNNKAIKCHGPRGFSLVEVLVVVSIFSLILILLAGFQSDVFSLNRILNSGLQSQSEVKKIVRPFSNEVRSATPSNLGAYPIATSDTNEFSFYTDIDGDGLREKIRYFLEDGEFKKGTIKPSGSPLEYDVDDEKIIKVIKNVTNSEIFTYYDSNYDGTASSTPLVTPVSPSQVRLVKIEITVDEDPNKPPAAITVTTQVSIRNLKDNL
jgi:prepilin-type N-terminal cleavage/methylation domain-containing protein